MASYGAPGTVSWQVISVVDGSGQDTTGRYVQGKTVTYQLKSGHTGTVFVPGTNATPDAVAGLIRQAAANLNAIASLKEGM
jgi:hypothetical protein